MLQSSIGLCQGLAIHGHAKIGEIGIALHLTKRHHNATVKCKPHGAVFAGEVANSRDPGGDHGVSEGCIGLSLTAWQVSLQVDSLELLPPVF